ncbi:MAG: hypothetical protein ACI9FN_003720 [Saprospiraceae bacterium]|jgi:uncharacterized protein (DUF1778 family)
MSLAISKKGESRVEFRVSNEDKELFEYAKQLRGFKTFSEFARHVITKEAKAIVKEENEILASKRDKELFFNTLMGDKNQPNESLLAAIKYHEVLIKA